MINKNNPGIDPTIKIYERLRKIREHFGYTHAEMAAIFGISESGYKKKENGISDPSISSLSSIDAELGISIDWLLFDRGPMFSKDLDNKASEKKQGNDLFLRELEDMVYLMERVPLLRHSVMGYFQRFKMKYKDFIDEELKKITAEVADIPKK
jgi:transcriptional regulator with XRE-family HTH domain